MTGREGDEAAGVRLFGRAGAGLSENSLKAIRSDLRYIQGWARLSGLEPAPPIPVEVVARFLVGHPRDGVPEEVEKGLVQAGLRRPGPHLPTTVRRRIPSLSVAHVEAGLTNPCADPQVRPFLARSCRQAVHEGWRPRRPDAVFGEVLDSISAVCGDDLMGVRDRAVIMFSIFSGGRGRSEVSSAPHDRLVGVGADHEYRLGSTKGVGAAETGVIPIYGRSARAMDAWLERSGVKGGALFRAVDPWGHVSSEALSGRGVDRIVKRRAHLAGLDPGTFSSRSLRSGYVTGAVRSGVPINEVMGLSFHRSVAGASVYYEAGSGLDNSAAKLSG